MEFVLRRWSMSENSSRGAHQFRAGQEALAEAYLAAPPEAPRRTYFTQHNLIFLLWLAPVALALAYAALVASVGSVTGELLWDMLSLVLLLLAMWTPPVIQFLRTGPLVIDPSSATVTYRRRQYKFTELASARLDVADTLMPGGGSIEASSVEASSVVVPILVAGKLVISAADQAPREKLQRIADELNVALVEYVERERVREWLDERRAPMGGGTDRGE